MNPKVRTRLIYTTLETLDDARELGGKLVDARLAACVNILPGMTSIFEWEGNRMEASEVVMFVKTRQECIGDAMRLLKASHPYEVPALIVIAPQDVDAEFAAWIASQTEA